MSVEVRTPVLGESVVEATVGAWLKREGELVQVGEPLVELETDKVNVDVAAERSGVLERIERKQGETVRPGEVLAVLGEPGAQPAEAASSDGAAATPAPAAEATLAAAEASPVPAEASAAPADGAPSEQAAPDIGEHRHSSPLARRLAQEHGIDLSKVDGTGTGGRVTREDVERYLARQATAAPPTQPAPVPPAERPAPAAGPTPTPPTQPPAPAPAAAAPAPSEAADPRGEERQRMSRRRQTIARHLLEAQQTAAMLTTFNDVDMTAVMAMRARRRDAFKERHGVGLGFMSFFTKAVVGALKAFPRLNAEIRGDEMVLKRYYDIGIAVGAEEGLVVPVVRDADRKSFAEIEREIVALGEKARSNTLTLEDLRGGTFTITNGGVFGSLLSTPILSPPQVGILGMHRTEQRPVARDGQVEIRPMMYLALTYDHRIVDGREAVQFLVRVKDLIEDPEALLLEG
jgi:2-oxoglutarate dehydrogenase E2 component (dihydrolipoamide succinyltransferase)